MDIHRNMGEAPHRRTSGPASKVRAVAVALTLMSAEIASREFT